MALFCSCFVRPSSLAEFTGVTVGVCVWRMVTWYCGGGYGGGDGGGYGGGDGGGSDGNARGDCDGVVVLMVVMVVK